MRRKTETLLSLLWIAGVLCLSSLLAPPPEPNPFTINGVALGMSREEVLALFPEPPWIAEDRHLALGRIEGWKEEVSVYLDDESRVRGVAGFFLELSGHRVSHLSEGKDEEETISRELYDFLGEPDRRAGQHGDFTREAYYYRFDLIHQIGCTGHWFFLGDTSHSR